MLNRKETQKGRQNSHIPSKPSDGTRARSSQNRYAASPHKRHLGIYNALIS